MINKAKRKAYLKAYEKVYWQRPEVKERRRILDKVYRQTPKRKAWEKTYRERNRTRRRVWEKAYRQRSEVRAKRKAYVKIYDQRESTKIRWKVYRHNPKTKIKRQTRMLEVKKKIIAHYSRGTMKCNRCGFSDMKALSIDHINGGGVKHIKEVCKGDLYGWIIKNNFPENIFQVLCMNCQWIKRHENNEFYKGLRV